MPVEEEIKEEEEDLVIVATPRLSVIEEEKFIEEAKVVKGSFIRPGLARKESRVFNGVRVSLHGDMRELKGFDMKNYMDRLRTP